MSYVKTVVCLACSYKYGGRCIAGKEIVSDGKYGGWIRPVSARPKGEVALTECRYENRGEFPKPLDILEIPLLKAVPQEHQTENHLIDPEKPWVKLGQLRWEQLPELCDDRATLWGDLASTNFGINDCLKAEEAAMMRTSLTLVWTPKLTIELTSRIWDEKSVRTYRGRFEYRQVPYCLSITDPAVRHIASTKQDGAYSIQDCYLCVSLGETFADDGRCHKLIAGILRNPPL